MLIESKKKEENKANQPISTFAFLHCIISKSKKSFKPNNKSKTQVLNYIKGHNVLCQSEHHTYTDTLSRVTRFICG